MLAWLRSAARGIRIGAPPNLEEESPDETWHLQVAGRRVVAVAAALVVAGCGSSSSSGSSRRRGSPDTSITFGTHQPLTGPAAPGYSEIAPASQAFFDYVNAHGGVFGRKIHLIIKDDAYNPTNTVNVVHQLVLQNNVFGIFEGLGTPTHTKVVGFLNTLEGARHLRRLGLPVLGQRHHPALHVRLAAQLHDRGQDPRPVHQAALRRQEGRRPLPGRRLRPGRPGRDRGRGARPARSCPSSPTSRARPRWRRR